jgi:hypothetical protein
MAASMRISTITAGINQNRRTEPKWILAQIDISPTGLCAEVHIITTSLFHFYPFLIFLRLVYQNKAKWLFGYAIALLISVNTLYLMSDARGNFFPVKRDE